MRTYKALIKITVQITLVKAKGMIEYPKEKVKTFLFLGIIPFKVISTCDNYYFINQMLT